MYRIERDSRSGWSSKAKTCYSAPQEASGRKERGCGRTATRERGCSFELVKPEGEWRRPKKYLACYGTFLVCVPTCNMDDPKSPQQTSLR